MDDPARRAAWFLEAAAVVSATLVSTWCLFMLFYSNPAWPGHDILWTHLWWSAVPVLIAFAALIGGTAAAIAQMLGPSAWLVIPAMWVGASWGILLVKS